MKRFTTMLGILTLTAASFLTNATPARSDVIIGSGNTYAAIAYSAKTGKTGYAYNYGSRGAAEAVALRNCHAEDARIVTWVNNGFCALALGDDAGCYGIGYSFGDGATNTYARNRALQECSKRTTGARIVLCVCSDDIAPEVRR